MIWERCHLSACISGYNSVKAQLIFINRQYNRAHECALRTPVPCAQIHSHSESWRLSATALWLEEKKIYPWWFYELLKWEKLGPTAATYSGKLTQECTWCRLQDIQAVEGRWEWSGEVVGWKRGKNDQVREAQHSWRRCNCSVFKNSSWQKDVFRAVFITVNLEVFCCCFFFFIACGFLVYIGTEEACIASVAHLHARCLQKSSEWKM